MKKMIFGVFAERENAENAINELEHEGFDPKNISIVMKNEDDAKVIENNTGADVAGGAATGATTGAVVGGLAGLLIGIGAIAIPGIGALLVAGPIAAALGLTGAAASTVAGATTGALAGGLIGALVKLGIPEEDAKVYEERVKSGAILVAVPEMDGKHKEVSSILTDQGAEQVKTVDLKDDNRSEAHKDTEMHTAAHM